MQLKFKSPRTKERPELPGRAIAPGAVGRRRRGWTLVPSDAGRRRAFLHFGVWLCCPVACGRACWLPWLPRSPMHVPSPPPPCRVRRERDRRKGQRLDCSACRKGVAAELSLRPDCPTVFARIAPSLRRAATAAAARGGRSPAAACGSRACVGGSMRVRRTAGAAEHASQTPSTPSERAARSHAQRSECVCRTTRRAPPPLCPPSAARARRWTVRREGWWAGGAEWLGACARELLGGGVRRALLSTHQRHSPR